MSTDVTHLLLRWCEGEADAREQLMPLVYDELRRIARRYLVRERTDHTLETGALVNEAYLKLVDQERVRALNRAHFYAIAATTMRRILVDHARSRSAAKRGGEVAKVSLDEALHAGDGRPLDLIALDDALDRLTSEDPLKGRIVEMRFFGGLTHQEIADAEAVSLSTVEKHWRLARAWLYAEMS